MFKTIGILLAAGGAIAYAESSLKKKRMQPNMSGRNQDFSHSSSSSKVNKKMNKRVDAEIDDSFPASDPPSWNSSI